jgi:phosphatidylglycerol---prolipoprotein diacylglyceryl transferase
VVDHGFHIVASGVQLHFGYAGMMLIAILAVLMFRVTKDFATAAERRVYYTLQSFTLIGALLGAKLAVLMGDALWPLEPFDHWWELVWSGRSIVGALLVGFVVAEIAKPLLHYRLPPNDRFAIVLPISIALGRVGCILAGCCRGIEHNGWLAVEGPDGVARYAVPQLEIAFHLAAAGLLWRLYRSGAQRGKLFALYVAAYGLFRFVTEFIRDTEKAFYGLSAYQWFAAGLLVFGAAYAYRRGRTRVSVTREATT